MRQPRMVENRWHFAAGSGNEKVIKVLLDVGVEVDAKADKDWTPLHCAAYDGYEKIAQVLLDAGAEG